MGLNRATSILFIVTMARISTLSEIRLSMFLGKKFLPMGGPECPHKKKKLSETYLKPYSQRLKAKKAFPKMIHRVRNRLLNAQNSAF